MNRNAEFQALWGSAVAAGMAAANSAAVQPMIVREGNILGGAKPGGQSWFVEGGACGFAWISVRPGNSPFANWAKKAGLMKPAYGGGVQYWVSEFGQSMQRKEAFADAAAEVLRQAGIKAYSDSRMD